LGGSGGTFANSSKQNAALVFTNLSSNVSTDRKLLISSGTSASVTHSLVNNDATYTVAFNNTGAAMDGSVSTTGTRTIQFGGINTGNNIFAEAIGDPSGGGTGAVTKGDAGRWVLTGSNTYTGATVISNGTLQIGNGTDAGSIGSTSAITNNSALVYNVGSGTRTIGATISGSGSLTQNSSGGSLILAGDNTYNGSTAVNAGTLLLSASGSISNSSAVNMNAEATFDTTAQSFTMLGSQTFKFTLDPTGTGSAGLWKSGSLSIGSGSVDFETLGALDDPAYVIAEYGSLTGTAFNTVANLPGGYFIDYNYNNMNQIALVVPEPGTLALTLGGLGLLYLLRRTRKP
jgi:fibronectin-binding autotransporter adhesin